MTPAEFCYNCGEVWSLCQCEIPACTYPELVSKLRQKIKELSSEADQRDAARYRAMRADPGIGMLVLAEATNQDTFGLQRNEEIKDSVRQEYIDSRIDELSSSSDTEER